MLLLKMNCNSKITTRHIYHNELFLQINLSITVRFVRKDSQNNGNCKKQEYTEENLEAF